MVAASQPPPSKAHTRRDAVLGYGAAVTWKSLEGAVFLSYVHAPQLDVSKEVCYPLCGCLEQLGEGELKVMTWDTISSCAPELVQGVVIRWSCY